MPPLQVLIVDDEPLGRERIRRMVAERSDVVVGGEAADGNEAVTLLTSRTFDLVFLDVQMPGRTGLEVIREVSVERMPPTIFVTAYDRFALDAFAVHAVDYLLKPFDADRFHDAVDHALARRTTTGDLEERLHRLLGDLEPAERPVERFLVKANRRSVFVRTEDVDWFEATGNYVTLHVGRTTHLLRTTMSALEAKLDRKRFIRIHRSTIVNLDRVKDLAATFNGEHEVRLMDGTRLTLSRGYRHILDLFV